MSAFSLLKLIEFNRLITNYYNRCFQINISIGLCFFFEMDSRIIFQGDNATSHNKESGNIFNKTFEESM